jgi:hypothetical protein
MSYLVLIPHFVNVHDMAPDLRLATGVIAMDCSERTRLRIISPLNDRIPLASGFVPPNIFDTRNRKTLPLPNDSEVWVLSRCSCLARLVWTDVEPDEDLLKLHLVCRRTQCLPIPRASWTTENHRIAEKPRSQARPN